MKYKGEECSTNDDTNEKDRLGKLWEERSSVQCFFEMVSGPGEKAKIRDAIRNAAEG